ncbi:MAG: hypothetical protein B6243_01765 [Anaerolineaceae bacterium 4572_5.2]|nr:MAG: hypothetical protein B6243_01765 [Anaerolineaceae bacterium 4572_5.2]
MTAKALTVKELKILLSKMPDDTLVVLSKDEAGNAFSPLCSYSTGTYILDEKPWQRGTLYDKGDSTPDNSRAKKAVALWPMH